MASMKNRVRTTDWLDREIEAGKASPIVGELHLFPFDGWWLLSRDDGREIVQGAQRYPERRHAEQALANRLERLESLSSRANREVQAWSRY